ncbi:MAG TPA: hypothetical protein DEG69_21445, partial [Flavobacteriaceae bacterium]|nr:hypothetical protein [Flavobacteriaceae bacterium]
NFASLTGDDVDDIDGRTSFHVGGVANIGITELFSVQPELIYSSQGASADDSDGDLTLKLDYINIPIMADFQLAEGFSLQGGPQVGFNISSKFDFDGDEEDVENIQTLDFGVGIGAQYVLPMNLFFQARYVIGITNVYEEFEGIDTEAQNSVVSVSVGYFFN